MKPKRKARTCPHCGKLPESTEEGTFWIRHPGNGSTIECKTFEVAMDWFEGFNVPYKLVRGKPEPFEQSYNRVKEYFKSSASK